MLWNDRLLPCAWQLPVARAGISLIGIKQNSQSALSSVWLSVWVIPSPSWRRPSWRVYSWGKLCNMMMIIIQFPVLTLSLLSIVIVIMGDSKTKTWQANKSSESSRCSISEVNILLWLGGIGTWSRNCPATSLVVCCWLLSCPVAPGWSEVARSQGTLHEVAIPGCKIPVRYEFIATDTC